MLRSSFKMTAVCARRKRRMLFLLQKYYTKLTMNLPCSLKTLENARIDECERETETTNVDWVSLQRQRVGVGAKRLPQVTGSNQEGDDAVVNARSHSVNELGQVRTC